MGLTSFRGRGSAKVFLWSLPPRNPVLTTLKAAECCAGLRRIAGVMLFMPDAKQVCNTGETDSPV